MFTVYIALVVYCAVHVVVNKHKATNTNIYILLVLSSVSCKRKNHLLMDGVGTIIGYQIMQRAHIPFLRCLFYVACVVRCVFLSVAATFVINVVGEAVVEGYVQLSVL